MNDISKAASVMGQSRSARKTAASRENGKKGGRPTNYFVVPAPGYYGDTAKVWSSHVNLEATKKATGTSGIVRVGHLRKGDKWLRVYEETYPVA